MLTSRTLTFCNMLKEEDTADSTLKPTKYYNSLLT